MTAHPEPGPGEVLVRETPAGPYTQEVRVGAHTWVSDEPPSAGGDDAGPAPYDLLGAALGACISMTLRMYADRKGWPVESISVLVGREKVKIASDGGYADHARPVRVHAHARPATCPTSSARGCSRSPTGAPCTARSSTAHCSTPDSRSRRAGGPRTRGRGGLPGVRCDPTGRSALLGPARARPARTREPADH